MTISEKYYRRFYKIKDDVKLTNEQLKVVNMMHSCLKENNKPKLPHGSILVNKKQLNEHLSCVKRCLQNIDYLMLDEQYKDFSSGTGGAKLAVICNKMNLTLHSVLHFQLNVPLERLCDINDDDIE